MSFSHNGDFEQLVEQITDVIYSRLNGEHADQAKMCGCTSECFHRCPERMHRVVDAGAARIGLVLGQTGSARDWASLIDHTLLKPDATESEIRALVRRSRAIPIRFGMRESDLGARVRLSFARLWRAGLHGDWISAGRDAGGR